MEATGCVPECAVMIDGPKEPYADVKWPAHWHIHQTDEHLELQRALNRLLEIYPYEASYGFMVDHSRPLSPNWATDLEAAAGDWRMALSGDHRRRINRFTGLRRLSAAMVTGGELVRAMGFVWPKFCVHLAGDDALELLGHHLGIKVHCDQIDVRDLHFYEGEIPVDENHKRLWRGKCFRDEDWRAFLAWRTDEMPALIERLERLIPLAARAPSLLTIACVKWGDLYGAEYVNNLYDMVRRNLPDGFPGKFVCFTENAEGITPGIEIRPLPEDGLSGWWNKLALFKPGVFKPTERVLYFDLDTLIAGPLDELASYDGPFAVLRDFYRSDGYGSGVMAWPGGFGADIWESWNTSGRPEIDGGDQAWIERTATGASLLQEKFPDLIGSYKVDCLRGLKRGLSVVCFHGEPKAHNCGVAWVDAIWKIGGATAGNVMTYCGVPDGKLAENIRHSSRLGLPLLTEQKSHHGTALIVGGGPSLKDGIAEIRLRVKSGQHVFALNNAIKPLADAGIFVRWQVLMDARPENAEFVKADHKQSLLLASQCDPSLFEAAQDRPVLLFHASIPGLRNQLPPEHKSAVLVGGGTTVLTRAMVAVHLLGYRTQHLFGVDSSFRDDEHHAYEQAINAGDMPSPVFAGGREFRSCPWMMAQVHDFQVVSAFLAEQDSEIILHGDGLLPHVATLMTTELAA